MDGEMSDADKMVYIIGLVKGAADALAEARHDGMSHWGARQIITLLAALDGDGQDSLVLLEEVFEYLPKTAEEMGELFPEDQS